jgi:ACS family hexuronate transporter-like MFS transporter
MIRWRIAILVSAAIALSYLDRQTLPVAVQAISRDIPLTNSQFSTLQSAFLFSYAFMYIGGGKLVDALNTRLSFTLIMVFWSLACASHGLAVTFSMLVASRLLLGMGEGGGFPAATRVVAEWFPTNERATAMGIINGGTAIGAIAAPPLIAVILIYTNWRLIFFVTGALGLLWTLWWRRVYFPPGEHPALTETERAKIEAGVALLPGATESRRLRWMELLRIRETWGLVAAKTLSDGAGYFYLFWLPKYLFDARGFNIKAVGATAGIPHVAAGIGCLLGGWFSSYLLRRRYSLDVARKVALGLSAAVMPFIMLVPHVPVFWAIVIFSVALFGQQSWSTLVMVLPTDLFPTNVVGTVAGLVGFGGAMGGVAFGELAGYLLDHGFGYRVVFDIAGTFHVIALLVIILAVPRVQRLDIDTSLGYQGAR